MKLSELSTGSNAYIEVERKEDVFSLSSKISGVFDGGAILKAPLHNNSPFNLIEDDSISVMASSDSKVFRWKCDSWKLIQSRGAWYLLMSASEDGVNCNRRDSYRVTLDTSIKCKATGIGVLDIILNDISLTGIGFTTTRELLDGQQLSFNLDESIGIGTTELIIKVVRCISLDRINGKFSYGASFLGEENPKLGKFIATKQMEEIRRRKSKM